MIAKTESHNSVLMAQSVTITNRAVNAVLPGIPEDKFVGLNRQERELKLSLLAMQRECQIYVPAVPSLEDINKHEAHERYRADLKTFLRPFLETPSGRKRQFQKLNKVFYDNSHSMAKIRAQLRSFENNQDWKRETRLTELSLYCLQWAVNMLSEPIDITLTPQESKEFENETTSTTSSTTVSITRS
jgi:hypothetical protein